MADETLRTAGLTVRYGGVTANDAVDVAVGASQVVGLIGPNGAGKTSLIDAVTGFTAAQGEVLLDGESVSGLAPHQRARRGISRTWQSLELFNDLSCIDNLLVASRRVSFRSVAMDIVRPSRRRPTDAAERALGVVGLGDAARRRPNELPLGQQKLVGVARALASDPRVVLLDEPAAGLDSNESQALGARLRDVAASGVGVLLVDHDMGLVLAACDFVYVLDFGKVIAAGTPEEIRHDKLVIDAYLGLSAPDPAAAATGRHP